MGTPNLEHKDFIFLVGEAFYSLTSIILMSLCIRVIDINNCDRIFKSKHYCYRLKTQNKIILLVG